MYGIAACGYPVTAIGTGTTTPGSGSAEDIVRRRRIGVRISAVLSLWLLRPIIIIARLRRRVIIIVRLLRRRIIIIVRLRARQFVRLRAR